MVRRFAASVRRTDFCSWRRGSDRDGRNGEEPNRSVVAAKFRRTALKVCPVHDRKDLDTRVELGEQRLADRWQLDVGPPAL